MENSGLISFEKGLIYLLNCKLTLLNLF